MRRWLDADGKVTTVEGGKLCVDVEPTVVFLKEETASTVITGMPTSGESARPGLFDPVELITPIFIGHYSTRRQEDEYGYS